MQLVSGDMPRFTETEDSTIPGCSLRGQVLLADATIANQRTNRDASHGLTRHNPRPLHVITP
ncbi:hypothetical protein E4U16_007765, partial [Claviceps sp. LM84 group G4]